LERAGDRRDIGYADSGVEQLYLVERQDRNRQVAGRLVLVNLVILTMRRSLPVYPRKQTISEPVGTSHLCQGEFPRVVQL
jgi:hypothetical protein